MTAVKPWLKNICIALIIILHVFLVLGFLNLYEEEHVDIAALIAGALHFLPTIIAVYKKSEDTSKIVIWNFIFLPMADIYLLDILTEKRTVQKSLKEDRQKTDNFICESCNKTFDKPKKPNKFLKICCLVLVYGLILLVIESIPTNDVSNILPRFIMDVAFLIIAIVHILTVIFKDNGRGKCPYCLSEDFVLLDSIKGQSLLKQIKKYIKRS